MILDATALLLLLNEKTPPPRDPVTKEPISDAHERVEELVNDIVAAGEQIIVTAPVLAELLVRAENAASGYMAELTKSSLFKLQSFDQKAAVEHALTTRKAIENGDKRDGIPDDWAKVKFDRQIVAIATSLGIKKICSDDTGLRSHAEKQGIQVLGIVDLKLHAQIPLDLQPEPAAASLPHPGEPDAHTEAASEPPSEIAEPAKPVPADTKANEKGSAVVETTPPPR